MEYEDLSKLVLIPELYIETFIFIAGFMALVTILLRNTFTNSLKGTIWFGITLGILCYIIPFIIILVVKTWGSWNYIVMWNDIILRGHGINIPFWIHVPSTFNKYYQKILIADATGILAGFGIWYYVKKRLKAAASD